MKFRRIINKLFEIVKSFGAFKYSIKKKKEIEHCQEENYKRLFKKKKILKE